MGISARTIGSCAGWSCFASVEPDMIIVGGVGREEAGLGAVEEALDILT